MKENKKRKEALRREELKVLINGEDFEISLRDYLMLRSAKVLYKPEAEILGIPYPLVHGWPKSKVLIDKETYGRLLAARKDHRKARSETKSVYCSTGETNPASDAFLQTYEWRRIRMQAIKKYGSRCMCCGATPADGAVMNVDHIKPRRLFPALALDLDNLQILCHECNHGKGNWDMTDWRPVATQAAHSKGGACELML